jgi:hypothetical protein
MFEQLAAPVKFGCPATGWVKVVNANWAAGPDGDHGRFEVMMVTEDDQPHVIAPAPRP